MSQRIDLKSAYVDTKANWEKENPCLPQGIFAIVSDDNTFKLFDGDKAFKDLPYIGDESGAIEEITEKLSEESSRAKEAEQANAKAIADESSRATAAEETNAKAIADEQARATSVEEANAKAIADESTRAKEAEGINAKAIADESSRATDAESTNAKAIADESSRAKEAEATLHEAKADKATTLAGYGIEDAYTKDEVDGKMASTFHYKGSKDNYADLPTEGNETGDVWNIKNADASHNVKAGDNVAWTGSEWDVLAGVVDLSSYYTKDETNTLIEAETTRATAAESTNAKAIADEQARATAAESTNAKAIADEQARATAIEQANAKAIADESTRATTAEETNAKAIADEQARATAIEQANAKAIADEQARAEGIEKEIKETYVPFVESTGGRKHIVLKNHDSILGTDTEGTTYNVAMISKWNVADFGTNKLHLNLNSVDDVTVNDKIKLVTEPMMEAKGYLTEHQDISFLASKTELEEVENKIPTVPSKVSAFENDKGYLTEHQSLEAYETKEAAESAHTSIESALAQKADKSELPVVPTVVSAFENDKGYLTEHQDISFLATKEEVEENYVPYVESSEGRKHIVLKNHDSVLGTDTEGTTYNVAMISKWNVADFGTNKLHLNLNSVDDVTVNDKIKLVTEPMMEDYAKKEELNNYATIASVQDMINQAIAQFALNSSLKEAIKLASGDENAEVKENEQIGGEISSSTFVGKDLTIETNTTIKIED